MPPVDEPSTATPSPTPATADAPTSAPSGDAELLASVESGSEEPFDAADQDFLVSKPAAAPAASPGDSAAPTPPAAQPAATPQTPAQPAVQPAAPAAAPAATAQPATPPVVQPPASAQPQPGAQPQAPAQAPAPQGDPMAPYKKWRADGESLLATTHFKLSPEQAEELAGDPATAVPKLMARTYLDAVENSVQAMANIMPQLIVAVTQQQRNEEKAEEEFFAKWPQLREHRQTVFQTGQSWRAMNPKGTKDDYIQNVGAMAIVALGLLPTMQQPQTPAQVPAANSPVFAPLTVGAPRQIGGPVAPQNTFADPSLYGDD